jgi:hypothetical protein
VVDASHTVADPFAPVHDGDLSHVSQASTTEAHEPEIWEPRLPAPSDPPATGNIRHWQHGPASVYRDRAGAPLFAVARFDTGEPDGIPGKELLPYTWGTVSGGRAAARTQGLVANEPAGTSRDRNRPSRCMGWIDSQPVPRPP